MSPCVWAPQPGNTCFKWRSLSRTKRRLPLPCNLEVQKSCELQGESEHQKKQDANKKSKRWRKVRKARKVLSWLACEMQHFEPSREKFFRKKELGDSVVKQSQLLWKHYGHVKASIKNSSWKSDDYSNSAYQIQIWMLDFCKYLLDFSSSSSGSCSSKCRDFTQCFQAFTPYAYLNGKLHSEFSELSSWDWYSDTAFLFTPCQWRTVVNVWQLLTAASQNLGRTRELPAKLPSFSVKKYKLHSAGGRFCVKHPSEDTVYLSSQIFLIHVANWFLMQNIFWKWNFCIAYIILDNKHMMVPNNSVHLQDFFVWTCRKLKLLQIMSEGQLLGSAELIYGKASTGLQLKHIQQGICR